MAPEDAERVVRALFAATNDINHVVVNIRAGKFDAARLLEAQRTLARVILAMERDSSSFDLDTNARYAGSWG